jgi:hypothetical protein
VTGLQGAVTQAECTNIGFLWLPFPFYAVFFHGAQSSHCVPILKENELTQSEEAEMAIKCSL